ncbi:helix-turn-helix transcriptional regulator [Glycomyces albus]
MMTSDCKPWDTARMSNAQPTLARRDLGIRLASHRRRLGLTVKQAADMIGMGTKTIQRIEAGTHGTKRPVIESLVRHYEISKEETSHIFTLFVRGAEKGWWEPYVGPGSGEPTRPDFPLFLETEQVAVHIRDLETEVIPGLLQTPEFLLEFQSAALPQPPEVAEAIRGLRTHRQKLMQNRADQPRLDFLISRSAIDYLEEMPGPVADGQRARLLEADLEPNIGVRVINRLHAAAAGAFAILTPPDRTSPFVYIDDLDGCRYIEIGEVVSLYEQAFEAARLQSVSIEEYLR